ncbi:MAG: AAA domain-containing protein [Methyloprofundus sp.]|nr:AAA domain-containing protein [Methyloprofundus sp.]
MATKKSVQLREPAEVQYKHQLEALKQHDKDDKPANWLLSPRAVLSYILGGQTLEAKIGRKKVTVEINRKFFGDRSLVEKAIVTLASERALLLVGEPGTGKSWLSEHLAAAITGNSTLTIQGTAGTTEEHIKYSWNIARVIAEGPNDTNLIPSPTMQAMQNGTLLRFEEVTRCVPDVQDSLVSILSDKAIAIPELPDHNMIWAKSGFNIIATANSRDQGVNDLSAALKRRFNYIYIPIIADKATEIRIIKERSSELMQRYHIPAKLPGPVIDLLATVFREIRSGVTSDGTSIKQASTTLSTAEAIAVALESALSAQYFGDGLVTPEHIAQNLAGSIVKEDRDDLKVLKEYNALVAKKRAMTNSEWQVFHHAMIAALN